MLFKHFIFTFCPPAFKFQFLNSLFNAFEFWLINHICNSFKSLNLTQTVKNKDIKSIRSDLSACTINKVMFKTNLTVLEKLVDASNWPHPMLNSAENQLCTTAL